jgi:hypothetical protein
MLVTKNLVEGMPIAKPPAIVQFASATMAILVMLLENANYPHLLLSNQFKLDAAVILNALTMLLVKTQNASTPVHLIIHVLLMRTAKYQDIKQFVHAQMDSSELPQRNVDHLLNLSVEQIQSALTIWLVFKKHVKIPAKQPVVESMLSAV